MFICLYIAGEPEVTGTTQFTDLKQAWYKPAVLWAYRNNIVGGTLKDGVAYLDPRGSATRAQVATILQRFCEKH